MSGKKIVVRVLIGGGVFLMLLVLGFGYLLYTGVDSSLEEIRRVESLPKVKGVLCSSNDLMGPVSEKNLAYYLLQIEYSSKRSGMGTGGAPSTSHETFLAYRKSICVEVDGVQYSFDLIPQFRPFVQQMDVNKEFDLSLKLSFQGAPELPKSLVGIDDRIDCAIAQVYRESFGEEKEIECHLTGLGYNSIVVEEYAWQQGDTIVFAGEIKGDKIELLW